MLGSPRIFWSSSDWSCGPLSRGRRTRTKECEQCPHCMHPLESLIDNSLTKASSMLRSPWGFMPRQPRREQFTVIIFNRLVKCFSPCHIWPTMDSPISREGPMRCTNYCKNIGRFFLRTLNLFWRHKTTFHWLCSSFFLFLPFPLPGPASSSSWLLRLRFSSSCIARR